MTDKAIDRLVYGLYNLSVVMVMVAEGRGTGWEKYPIFLLTEGAF